LSGCTGLIMTANQPHSLDAAITFLFHNNDHWRRAGDEDRWLWEHSLPRRR